MRKRQAPSFLTMLSRVKSSRAEQSQVSTIQTPLVVSLETTTMVATIIISTRWDTTRYRTRGNKSQENRASFSSSEKTNSLSYCWKLNISFDTSLSSDNEHPFCFQFHSLSHFNSSLSLALTSTSTSTSTLTSSSSSAFAFRFHSYTLRRFYCATWRANPPILLLLLTSYQLFWWRLKRRRIKKAVWIIGAPDNQIRLAKCFNLVASMLASVRCLRRFKPSKGLWRRKRKRKESVEGRKEIGWGELFRNCDKDFAREEDAR